MLKQLAFACAAAFVMEAFDPIDAHAQDRFALVIGNSKYRSVSALTNPARDADAVGALLKDAGFQVTSALDLDKSSLSKVVRFFTTSISEKPQNSVVLIYFAGHGVQVDGENFLMPVDATIAREADVPLEAMRLGDLMSMLETVRARTRIVILDACRDNPFGDIANTAPRGLALVNAPAGTLLAYSTSPGHTAEDGSGGNSPFALALMKSAREPGLPIETALKNVRLAVHGATGGRQTPWEVSALTEPFSFFPGATAIAPAAGSAKTADAWRTQLQSLPARDAFAVAIRENDIVVYEQYLALYGSDPLAVTLRAILDRRLMMLAWQEAVALNTEAGFAAFLARYPNTDLSATARRLQQRAQGRMAMASVLGGARDANLIQAVSAPGGTCPCAQPAIPGRPANPGSVPPGTRASIPVTSPPGAPIAPLDPGGPVLIPGRPAYLPALPVMPPRINDRVRIRDPHKPDRYPDPPKRDGSKTDRHDQPKSTGRRPDGDRGHRGPRGREPAHAADQRHGGRDIRRGRQVEPRIHHRGGGRGEFGRGPQRQMTPQIAVQRHAPPRFQGQRGGGDRSGNRFGGRGSGRGGGFGMR